MSKLLYVISKDDMKPTVTEKLVAICERLSPDNITPNPPKVYFNGTTTAFAVVNPMENLLIENSSVLLGKLYERAEDWAKVGAEFPDGSYALFRNHTTQAQLVSDYASSRTIWYYFDKEKLISSTSQRAIIMYLESFEFNEEVSPWILSSGTLGPGHSWDKRIHSLAINSSLTLDKVQWNIKKEKLPIDFVLTDGKEVSHEKNLREALDETFKHMELDYSRWSLPLSGGYDSRGILALIKKNSKHEGLSTFSWGLKSSITQKGNDAYIAKKLADHYKIPHNYFHTDLADENLSTIVDRFLYLGEGRIDHIRGYLDGFNLFKTMFESGIQGIIRGDECFEAITEPSEFLTRFVAGYTLCEDFINLKEYESSGLLSQKTPSELSQRQNESLDEWGHRLYLEYRLPIIIAALNDLKVSYVEIINPLLSKRIIDAVRVSPMSDRKNKKLFRKIVKSISPSVKIANKDAVASTWGLLENKDFLALLQDKLSKSTAKELFTEKFLTLVNQGLKKELEADVESHGKKSLRSFIKRLLPDFVKDLYRDKVMVKKLSESKLGFRTFIITRMNEILMEDSLFLKNNDKNSLENFNRDTFENN